MAPWRRQPGVDDGGEHARVGGDAVLLLVAEVEGGGGAAVVGVGVEGAVRPVDRLVAELVDVPLLKLLSGVTSLVVTLSGATSEFRKAKVRPFTMVDLHQLGGLAVQEHAQT